MELDYRGVSNNSATALPQGRSGHIASYEDVNGDGFTDAVFRFEVRGLSLSPGTNELTLKANLYASQGGTRIQGSDFVRVV